MRHLKDPQARIFGRQNQPDGYTEEQIPKPIPKEQGELSELLREVREMNRRVTNLEVMPPQHVDLRYSQPLNYQPGRPDVHAGLPFQGPYSGI